MNKNYETPAVEILEIQLEGVLCASVQDDYQFYINDQEFGGNL